MNSVHASADNRVPGNTDGIDRVGRLEFEFILITIENGTCQFYANEEVK